MRMNNFQIEEERKKQLKSGKVWTQQNYQIISQYLFKLEIGVGTFCTVFLKNEVDNFSRRKSDIERKLSFCSNVALLTFYVEEYNGSYHRKY